MANIFLAIPCYGGLIYSHCMRGVIQLTHALAQAGHSFVISTTQGESLVQRARNTLVHNFLKSECDTLFFIDADIVFNPRDVLAMLACDKPVLGGAYPKKSFCVENIRQSALQGDADIFRNAGEFVVNVDRNAHEVNAEGFAQVKTDRGCLPVMEVGTGFLMIKRQVFLDMAKAFPESAYISDAKDTLGEMFHAWFDCAIMDGRYLSEDYLFCRKWQKMGGTVYCYLPAHLEHVGTHVYSGDLKQVFKPVEAQHHASEWSDIPTLDEMDPQRRWHLYRYDWAAKRVKGEMVANAACGAGYGNPILAGEARTVTGYDRSEAAIAIAREKYASVRSRFSQFDVEALDLQGFDALVSLETIEHLKDPVAWLRGLSSTVKELVISVPIIPTKHVNEYHLHDFTEQEIVNIVKALGWEVVETEYQDEWKPKSVLLVYAVRN